MACRGNLNTLHLYSLRAGKEHPLAHSHDIQFQNIGLGSQWSPGIKIHGRLVGIVNLYVEHGPGELTIFDWVNGVRVLVRAAKLNWTPIKC